MTDVMNEDSTTVEIPEKQSQGFERIDRDDVAWSIFCGIQLFAAYTIADDVLLTLAIGIAYVLSMYRMQYARAYYTFLVDLPCDLWIRYVKKGRMYDREAGRGSLKKVMPHPRLRSFDTGGGKPPKGYLDLSNEAGYGVGIIASGSMVAVSDGEAQVAAVEILANQTRTNVGKFASVYAARPYNPWPERNIRGSIVNPYIMDVGIEAPLEGLVLDLPPRDEESKQRDRMLHANLVERDRDFHQVASNPQMMIMLTVPHDKKQKSNDTMSTRQYRKVFHAAEVFVSQLHQFGAIDAHIATIDEMRDHYRMSWDAVDVQEYYDAVQDYQADWSSPVPQHQPSVVTWKKSYIRYGNNFVGALIATTTPGKFNPIELDALYGAVDDEGRQILYSLVVAGENGSAKLESWGLKRGTLLDEDLQDMIHGADYRDIDFEAQQRSEESRKRIAEIGLSRNRQYYFNIVVIVHAESAQQLDDDIETMATIMRALSLKPVRVEGERALARTVASGIGIDTM